MKTIVKFVVNKILQIPFICTHIIKLDSRIPQKKGTKHELKTQRDFHFYDILGFFKKCFEENTAEVLRFLKIF